MKKQQGFTLIELMIVVAIIAILAAIAIPQYQAYVARSQAARVFGEAGQVKTAVEDCMNNGKYVEGVAADQCDTGKTGSSIQAGAGKLANGNGAPTGTGVPVVTLANTGIASIQATLGNRASSRINTKTLTWSRDADGTWTCATTIEARYAPSGCTPVTAP